MRRTVLTVVVAFLLAGCGGAGGSTSSGSASESGAPPVTLTILAAASFTDVLPQVAEEYMTEHPNVTIDVSFGSSAALAQQVVSGAPADAIITASSKTMQPVTEADVAVGEPVTIAQNRLEIAVPADNPGNVATLQDFTKPDLKLALCAESVPCGTAADQAFAKAGITPSVDTREQDVRAVLTKVQLGEVDAGIVYRTDVVAAGDQVKGVTIPDADNVTVQNQAVAIKGDNEEAATEFVEFLSDDAAQDAFSAAGFDAP